MALKRLNHDLRADGYLLLRNRFNRCAVGSGFLFGFNVQAMKNFLCFVLLFFASSAFSAIESVLPSGGGVPSYGCQSLGGGATAAEGLAVFQARFSGGSITWPALTLSASGTVRAGVGAGCYSAAGALQYNASVQVPVGITCPVPVSGSAYTFNDLTGMCERVAGIACVSPQVQSADGLTCVIPPKFAGSGGLAVCTADGNCASGNIFPTAAAACASYDSGTGAGNAHSSFSASGVCKTWYTNPDGSVFGTKYFTISNSVPCAAGDSSCAASASLSSTALKSSLSTAVNDAAVSAAVTSAQSAAVGATLAAGGSQAAADAAGTAAAVQAAGSVAAQTAAASVVASFCQSNPQSAQCSPSTVQAVSGGALPAVSGSWYSKKYPSGVSGVMTSNFTTMKATPLFNAISSLVPTISGAAINGCFTLNVGFGNTQLCMPPMVLNFLGICMLLTAAFAARAIVFGG